MAAASPTADASSSLALLRRVATLKRAQAEQVHKITRIDHARSVARQHDVHFWIKLVVTVVGIAGIWIGVQMHALRVMYAHAYAWWHTGYAHGPRPRGVYHRSLTCVCLAAEYPPVATLVCSALPQTSAIFILMMINHFGSHLRGVHYSGDRAQLLGTLNFDAIVRSYDNWNVDANPWRFLFPTQSRFVRSTAVIHARSMPAGGSMLEALFDGGLCRAALLFWNPDTSAAQMCRALLDEEVVYTQHCGAVKLAKSLQQGSTVGALTGSVAGRIVAQQAAKSAIQAQATSIVSTTAEGVAEGAASDAAAGAAAGAATAGAAEASVGAVAAAAGPVGWLFLAAVLITTTVVTTAVATTAIDSATQCPGGNRYVLVRRANGAYERIEWDGDAKNADDPKISPKAKVLKKP
jgi:hypothetical protein